MTPTATPLPTATVEATYWTLRVCNGGLTTNVIHDPNLNLNQNAVVYANNQCYELFSLTSDNTGLILHSGEYADCQECTDDNGLGGEGIKNEEVGPTPTPTPTEE